MRTTRWAVTALAVALAAAAGRPASGDTIELTGLVRDFKRGDQPGGHPDFETQGNHHGGHTLGITKPRLGPDGLPAYNPRRPPKDPISSAGSFAQWYRDVPGVNQSLPYTIRLSNGADKPGGIYTYRNDAFFPIDNQLWTNQGLPHNYNFTFQLRSTFTYQPGQRFAFVGDDDVWVFINGTLVIDLGGIHSALGSALMLFDGKAFVARNNFTPGPATGPLAPGGSGTAASAGHDGGPGAPGSLVQAVNPTTLADLQAKWAQLKMDGPCPFQAGDYYLELDLNAGEADTRCVFRGTTVEVLALRPLFGVTLRFADGSEQTFDDLTAPSGVFGGTGLNGGKPLLGAWVRLAPATSPGAPGPHEYYGAGGSGGPACVLDFFFAERQTTSSTFRIDTSIVLADEAVPIVKAEPPPPPRAPPPVVVAAAPPPPPPAPAPPPPPPVRKQLDPARPRNGWLPVVIGGVLMICAVAVSVKGSKRGHQD